MLIEALAGKLKLKKHNRQQLFLQHLNLQRTRKMLICKAAEDDVHGLAHRQCQGCIVVDAQVSPMDGHVCRAGPCADEDVLGLQCATMICVNCTGHPNKLHMEDRQSISSLTINQLVFPSYSHFVFLLLHTFG